MSMCQSIMAHDTDSLTALSRSLSKGIPHMEKATNRDDNLVQPKAGSDDLQNVEGYKGESDLQTLRNTHTNDGK